MSESIKLNDGNMIPQVGLGTFRGSDAEMNCAVKAALKAGYRHFDCAWLYQNEKSVGQAIKEAIIESNGELKREDIVLVGKVWNTFHSKEQAEISLDITLKDLQVDYIDLFLIHWPMGFKEGTNEPFPKDENGEMLFSDINYTETWRALESFKKQGKCKSIGVSNFNIKQLQDIMDNCEIKPAMNQIEVNPYVQSYDLVEFCQKNDIVVSIFGPIGAGKSGYDDMPELAALLENETIQKLSKKYDKSSAQICLRWAIDRNLVVLPKSVTPSRIIENITLFDFKLSGEDMAEMKKLDHNLRIYPVKNLSHHKYYPF